jgi:hypothetical protein
MELREGRVQGVPVRPGCGGKEAGEGREAGPPAAASHRPPGLALRAGWGLLQREVPHIWFTSKGENKTGFFAGKSPADLAKTCGLDTRTQRHLFHGSPGLASSQGLAEGTQLEQGHLLCLEPHYLDPVLPNEQNSLMCLDRPVLRLVDDSFWSRMRLGLCTHPG